MRLVSLFTLTLALVLAPGARADELGGSGFDVPQSQANEWLWGIEGLVRTPFDVSADIGVAFFNHEMDGKIWYDDRAEGGGSGLSSRTGTIEVEPDAINGGFRVAGLIGYWSCCVLVEPALSFRANRPFGNERTDDTPFLPDPNGDFGEGVYAEAEIKEGWSVMVGPQMTWMIPDDLPFVGGIFGGLPLVFFPALGVTHIDWDVEFASVPFAGGRPVTADRNFEDDAFTVGFDIDFPLPGSQWNFTHALTFGFRWIESPDDHDIGPIELDSNPLIPGAGGCTAGTPIGNDDQTCVNFDGLDGWRIGLYYRVTWNDFGGFFRKHVFGPLD